MDDRELVSMLSTAFSCFDETLTLNVAGAYSIVLLLSNGHSSFFTICIFLNPQKVFQETWASFNRRQMLSWLNSFHSKQNYDGWEEWSKIQVYTKMELEKPKEIGRKLPYTIRPWAMRVSCGCTLNLISFVINIALTQMALMLHCYSTMELFWYRNNSLKFNGRCRSNWCSLHRDEKLVWTFKIAPTVFWILSTHFLTFSVGKIFFSVDI